MAGISIELMAARLGRHRLMIFRELKRNAFEDPQMPDLHGYYCVTANDMALSVGASCASYERLGQAMDGLSTFFNSL